MNAIVKSLIAVAVAASFSMNAMADDDERGSREQRRDKFEQMRPSERQDMRQEMRRDRHDVAPQERREMREKMNDRFERMSPRERREMREEMRHRSSHESRQDYGYSNRGNARIVLGGNEGLVIQRVEFMLGL
ncbi:MAG: hypothetical protein PHP57_01915 [Sideroxydans sp.]|nr:hypothetical protein [Sideroxydans sp.]